MGFNFSLPILIILAICLTSHSHISTEALFVAQCPRSLWRTSPVYKVSAAKAHREYTHRGLSRVVCTADTTSVDIFKPIPWSPARDAQEYRVFGSRRLGDLRKSSDLMNGPSSLAHFWHYPAPWLIKWNMPTDRSQISQDEAATPGQGNGWSWQRDVTTSCTRCSTVW